MRNTLTIAFREIRSGFVTPLAYVVLASFMFLSGFFFFSLLQQFNSVLQQAMLIPDENPSLNAWVIVPYYQTLEVVLIFLIPVLTMRSIAEEKRSGTFEMLLTSPISVSQLIVGKFLGVATIAIAMLVLSLAYPLILVAFSDPEVMPIFIGWFGVVLFALSFISIGVAVSACTESQTVAGVVSIVTLLVFYILDAPAEKLGGSLAGILKYLAPTSHMELFVKGVLTGTDVVYFLSVCALGLFFANRVIDAERWR